MPPSRSRSRFGSTDPIYVHMTVALLTRLAFIVYGEHMDKTSVLKYTDVDYHVFTDSARKVTQGKSPYDRHTFRYTPLLAWLSVPNVYVHFTFGKFVFSLLDCLAGWIIYRILVLSDRPKSVAVKCAFLWLYNPLVIGISTRGSAESVMAVLVLSTLLCLQQNMPFFTGLFLGTSIHFKLYPIMYSLPLYLALTPNKDLNFFHRCLLPDRQKCKLVLGTILSFLGLTVMCVLLYGEKYLEESLFHHLSRTDTRHNFSIYFYLLYLSGDYHVPGLGLAMFVPQVVLVTIVGFRFGRSHSVAFALFVQTLIFVTFNKVVTSQYFLWYLLLLPLAVPSMKMSIWKAMALTALWVAAQVSWLVPAYLVEFRGVNAFVSVWLESIAFFCCNVVILMSLISNYIIPVQSEKGTVCKIKTN